MAQIYVDYPHRNTTIIKQGEKWVFKEVNNKKIQEIEYEVQKMLYPTQNVPLCKDYCNDGYWEEFIFGDQINQLSLTSKNIKSIARALREIHSYPIYTSVRNLLTTPLVKKGKYLPLKVYSLITQDYQNFVSKYVDTQKIETYAERLDFKLKEIPYDLSIIHGDLSGNNVIIDRENRVKIIDWTDCRIDIGACDVVQFFYHTNIDLKLRNDFLVEYNSPLCFELMFKIQLIFLQLYDFINEYRKTTIVNYTLVEKINNSLDLLQ